jgi:hypothetical protein
MNSQKFINELTIRISTIEKKIEIIDYTDKSFAIFGNTIALKEQMKSFNGKYNANLKHPNTGIKEVGWIFPKNKKKQVEDFVNKFYGDNKTLISMFDTKNIVELIFKENEKEIAKNMPVKRNLGDYNKFVAENMEIIKKDNPDMSFADAMDMIAKLWNENSSSSDDE